MNKNKRLTKQNFLTNLQDQLSANSKKPRIPQRFLFYSTPNQASQYLKSLVNFQQRRRGFFFRNFQLSKKFVFCLRITRRFKVFLLLSNGQLQRRKKASNEHSFVGLGLSIEAVGVALGFQGFQIWGFFRLGYVGQWV